MLNLIELGVTINCFLILSFRNKDSIILLDDYIELPESFPFSTANILSLSLKISASFSLIKL